MNSSKFREDINGLRAIAVLSVVIFHFSKDKLPGGFAGVDVFFVISGFLMTSIIFRGLENNSFSIIKFLKARAVRIIPALLFVVFLVLFVGYLSLDTITYQAIGKHALSSLLFISNYIYKSEAGYFDAESQSKFFLHTWSLSVEWQFYIIYPIILLILKKYLSIKTIKFLVLLSALVSYIYCIFITYRNPTSAYYMLPSRAWEMMIGGLAFLYPIQLEQKKRLLLEILGIVLIFASLFFFNDTNPWPGYIAFLPVFGAYLVILANNKKSLLSGFLFKKIGLYSYSIYLIHWPVLVFCHTMDIKINFAWYIAGVILSSFIIYELIEKKRDYNGGLIAFFFIAIACALSFSIDGADYRIQNQQFKLTRQDIRFRFEGHLRLPSTENIQYINGNEDSFDYILIGDSHARHYYSYFKQSGTRVASLAIDGCKSTKNFYQRIDYSSELNKICKDRYSKTLAFIKKHNTKPVIYSSLWSDGTVGSPRIDGDTSHPNNIINELEEFLTDIGSNAPKVFIVADTPGSKKMLFECLSGLELPVNRLFNSCDSKQKDEPHSMTAKLAAFSNSHHNVFIIDPSKSLCSNGECLVIDNGMPIYTDASHLTRHGADIVGKYIMTKIPESK